MGTGLARPVERVGPLFRRIGDLVVDLPSRPADVLRRGLRAVVESRFRVGDSVAEYAVGAVAASARPSERTRMTPGSTLGSYPCRLPLSRS